MQWEIYINGVASGTVEAIDQKEAFNQYALSSGYQSFDTMIDVSGLSMAFCSAAPVFLDEEDDNDFDDDYEDDFEDDILDLDYDDDA